MEENLYLGRGKRWTGSDIEPRKLDYSPFYLIRAPSSEKAGEKLLKELNYVEECKIHDYEIDKIKELEKRKEIELETRIEILKETGLFKLI
ncbi:MAG: hypothetical protein ACOYT4_00900 [Nanoarchaeota archaeon]